MSYLKSDFYRIATALTAQPDSPHRLREMIGFYNDQRDFKFAEACLRQLVKVKPDDYMAKIDLGDCLERQLKYKEAENSYRDAINQEGNVFLAYLYMGRCLSKQERHMEAATSFEMGQTLLPFMIAHELKYPGITEKGEQILLQVLDRHNRSGPEVSLEA